MIEGSRERIQAFEGVCIGRAGGGLNENFTVRKISYGEGVERVSRLFALVDSIELMRRGRVRRAKLYYLRGLTGKAARIVERRAKANKIDTDLVRPRPCRKRRKANRKRHKKKAAAKAKRKISLSKPPQSQRFKGPASPRRLKK